MPSLTENFSEKNVCNDTISGYTVSRVSQQHTMETQVEILEAEISRLEVCLDHYFAEKRKIERRVTEIHAELSFLNAAATKARKAEEEELARQMSERD